MTSRPEPEPPVYATADGKPWPYEPPMTFPLAPEDFDAHRARRVPLGKVQEPRERF